MTFTASNRTGVTDALLLDAGVRQALAAMRSLGKAGLVVASADAGDKVDPRKVPSFASRWSVWNRVLPSYQAEPDGYAAAVENLIERCDARVLVPSTDGSIAAIRPIRERIEKRGTAVALATDGALDLANDKARTLEVATSLGIPIPRTVAITDPDRAREAFEEVGFPAVVKPVQSWAIRDGRPSARLIARCVTGMAAGLSYVEEITGLGGSVVVQEWAGGLREAVNLVCAGDRVVGELAQVAYRTAPVLGGVSVIRETIPMPPRLREAAFGLVEAIGLEGYAEIEFRQDSAGRPLLMEINARLTAGVELGVRSGVDFPLLMWKWAAGERVEPAAGYRIGQRMRFLSGDLEWLWEVIKHPDLPDGVPPGRAVGSFAGEFFRRQAYDYFDPRDLRPALVASALQLQEIRRRIAYKRAVSPGGLGTLHRR